MFHSFLRWFSRGVILKRKLPPEFKSASLFVSPESALSYWKRDLSKVDPLLLSMARELVKPGMRVWDIGANVGLFSFAAAALGAEVVAVEADPWLAALLRRSQELNQLPVTVVPAAISSQTGTAVLQISREGRASNTLQAEGSGEVVHTITLDSLLADYAGPDVIKMDIEGMELAALKGGAKVLALRPVLFCEVSASHGEVGKLLTDAGYVLYAARSKERTPLTRPSRDTLAIPS